MICYQRRDGEWYPIGGDSMATKKDIQAMQERLKVKSEQLATRVKVQELQDKHAELTKRLKNMGGRIR